MEQSVTEITMEKVKAEWRQHWEAELLSDEFLGRSADELEMTGWHLPSNGAETAADLRAALSHALSTQPKPMSTSERES